MLTAVNTVPAPIRNSRRSMALASGLGLAFYFVSLPTMGGQFTCFAANRDMWFVGSRRAPR